MRQESIKTNVAERETSEPKGERGGKVNYGTGAAAAAGCFKSTRRVGSWKPQHDKMSKRCPSTKKCHSLFHFNQASSRQQCLQTEGPREGPYKNRGQPISQVWFPINPSSYNIVSVKSKSDSGSENRRAKWGGKIVLRKTSIHFVVQKLI